MHAGQRPSPATRPILISRRPFDNPADSDAHGWVRPFFARLDAVLYIRGPPPRLRRGELGTPAQNCSELGWACAFTAEGEVRFTVEHRRARHMRTLSRAGRFISAEMSPHLDSLECDGSSTQRNST
jgi:hypothetical protein